MLQEKVKNWLVIVVSKVRALVSARVSGWS